MASSRTTIGLLGHSGAIGSQVLLGFCRLHKEGKINLVILHKPGSALDAVAPGVETRVIDLSAQDGPAFDAALKGLQVVVSLIGAVAQPLQVNLIPALKRSAELITFIPSDLAANWTAEELDNANAGFLKMKADTEAAFEKAGIPVTRVRAGLFIHVCMAIPMLGWDLKGNKIWQYADSQDIPVPWVSNAFVGAALTQMMETPPQDLVGKDWTLIEFTASNTEITKVLESVHGKPTEIMTNDDAGLKDLLNNPNPFVVLAGLLWQRAGKLGFHYNGSQIYQVDGWKTKGVEGYVKELAG